MIIRYTRERVVAHEGALKGLQRSKETKAGLSFFCIYMYATPLFHSFCETFLWRSLFGISFRQKKEQGAP